MRYNRQRCLPEIGSKGQEKIASARVLVVGAGGLGAPALMYLAGAGVGTIGIVDFDTVDISNLQRQTIFKMMDVGHLKADAARDNLLAFNPDIRITSYTENLSIQNALSLFSDYDVIIDATDNFPAKYLINDAAVKTGKPVIFGAIQGFDGQVSVFDTSNGGCCYRCLYPEPPKSLVMNCAEIGVIGALAGIIGSMQAMETLKIIVGDASFVPLKGKLLLLDSRSMETRIVRFPKRHDCTVCSAKREEISLVSYPRVCVAATASEISCSAARLENNSLFIDVRERVEWDSGHVNGALHLPLSVLRSDTDIFMPYKDIRCILYCQRGARSQQAAEILRKAGFVNIVNLSGGFEEWENAR